ncbi:MAG: T9SS type A sorting domain-containing protein [Saprospiraceae bacterium]|nr:T9SS type A sorting domain-containing protein [Saprospiraceae bacterium]
MRIKFTLFLFSLVATSILVAQGDRYLDQVFDEVEVTMNVPYGENYTVLALPSVGHTVKQPLVMDVYQPAGDTIKGRPLVIYLHTGNFLPIRVNQGLTGSMRDSATVEVCTRLAKMGYVVASADYRLGWNPGAETQPLRALGLINAAYRGLQDTRTCIRYFKRDFTEFGDNYSIDTSKIVVWGQGTGGYIALATATLDDFFEIVTTTMPAGKFLTDLTGDGMPDPMVTEMFNGDINGTSLATWPGGGTIPAGDTMCIPNHVGYSSDFQLVVNMGGALGDISWMDDATIPVIAYHVPLDQFAPYESRILVVPTTGDAIVEVQGSLTAVRKAVDLGLNDVFGENNDIYTDAAIAASAAAGHEYVDGLYPLVVGLNVFMQPEGSPWDWWEPSAWDTIVHPSAGMGPIPAGASYDVVARLTNAMMSPEKGRAYIDTIVGYYAPRAFAALGLGTSTDVTNLDRTEVGFSVGPNPSAGLLRMQSDSKNPMLRARIVDITGKTVWYHHQLNVSQYEVNHQGLSPGMYILEVGFDEGTVVEKIMVE